MVDGELQQFDFYLVETFYLMLPCYWIVYNFKKIKTFNIIISIKSE